MRPGDLGDPGAAAGPALLDRPGRRLPRALRPGPPGPLLFGGEVTRPGAGYLLSPLGDQDGRLRFTFVGSDVQLREILARARQRRLRYRVVALGAARFGTSPIDRLTERQRTVLRAAHRLGYFDSPRRTDARSLARALGIRAATTVEHLRKAEKRTLDDRLET